MQLKWLFFTLAAIGTATAIAFSRKLKNAATDIQRLRFLIARIGVPSLKGGTFALPLTITLQNPTPTPINTQALKLSLFIEIFIVQADGTTRALLSGAPQIQKLNIPADGQASAQLILQDAIPSFLINIFQLKTATQLLIKMHPRLLGTELPPISKTFPFTLSTLL